MPKDPYTYRALAAGPGGPLTLDKKARTVEVIAASENPVVVFDYERYEKITEVLLMTGAQIPENRQITLLDTHSRYDTSRVIGSFREMKIEVDELIGVSYFSSVPEVASIWTKVEEGHLTDFSLGYQVKESILIREGESETVNGKMYEGPLRVVTKWIPRELSVVPIAADQITKARAEAPGNENINKIQNRGDETMTLEEKKRLQEQEDERIRLANEDAERMRAANQDPPAPEGGNPPGRQDAGGDPPDSPGPTPEKIRADERERVQSIDTLCERFECMDLRERFISEETSVDRVREEIVERVMKRPQQETPYRGPLYTGADEKDKFRAAAEDALMIRADFAPEKPAPGADELTGYSLRELCRHSLRIANQPTGGNVLQMIGRALTTSDFPLILAAVANKSLFEGFTTAEEQWDQWCATGQVSDFKVNKSVRIGEFSDLEEIPEETEYRYGKRTEAQEQYQIATYGKIFPISRQAIINDDLGAITSNLSGQGEAASRLIGDTAWAVLTGNAAMGDTVALFHAVTHGNLATSPGAPGIATIQAGILAMKSQKDLQGLRRLNIRPTFFLCPIALEGATEVFFRSAAFADSDTVATDSSLAATRVNPYAGKYFTRIYEPRLDDNSTTAWYLAGPKGKTVTLFFLNGMKTPYLETKNGWTVDGVEYKVRIDVGGKAMDWKALYKDAGA